MHEGWEMRTRSVCISFDVEFTWLHVETHSVLSYFCVGVEGCLGVEGYPAQLFRALLSYLLYGGSELLPRVSLESSPLLHVHRLVIVM